MAIVIPNFESVEEKIEWIRSAILDLAQDAPNPSLEADRLTLVSALDAALVEGGVEVAPPVVPAYIPEVLVTPPPVESQ
jgi:hypothetical protein